MFSRSRPYLRSRRLSAVLDTVAAAPNEPPLLFLYPRWFISALSTNSHIATTDIRRTAPSLSSRSCSQCRLPVGGSSRRWLSSTTPVTSNGVVQAETPEQGLRLTAAQRKDQSEVSEGDVDQDIKRASISDHGAPVEHLPTSASPLDNDFSTGPPNSNADLPPETESPPGKAPLRKVVAATAKEKWRAKPARVKLTHSSGEKTISLLRTLSGTDFKKLRYGRHVIKYARKQGRMRRAVHWTDLVALLEDLQQDTRVWSKHTREKVIHVPEETVALMAGMSEMEENIWHVAIHNGGRIRVLDPAESEGPYRKVIISGSKRVIELVESGILRAQARQDSGDPLLEIRKSPVPIIPSVAALRRRNLQVPLIRGVWHRQPTSDGFRALDPLGVDQIPRPSAFTIRKFAEYIEDIVSSRVPPHLQKELYADEQETHENMIEKILVGLFSDDANQKYVSTSAVNMALSYLCRHEFLSAARLVLSKSESVASADTYNILLQVAARRRDLNIFRHILLSMSRLHVRPNEKTWVAFLQCLVSPNIKAQAMQHLKSKGFLDHTSTIRAVLQLTVHHSFALHLERGGRVSDFIEVLNHEYGEIWRSALLINQMVRQLLARKDISGLVQLLEICNRQRLPVDSMTLKLILTFFSSDVQKALWFMFRYTDRHRYPFDARTLEKLFLMAFKGKSFNICRVLWRYACMYGMVGFRMKSIVMESVTRNTPQKGTSPINQAWRVNAGKVIIGLELHQTEIELPQPIQRLVPSGFEDNPVSSLVGYKPAGPERTGQLDLAHALVQRDIQAGPLYKPCKPLDLMLEAAAALDKEWKHTPRPLNWFVQNAIQVPIRKASY